MKNLILTFLIFHLAVFYSSAQEALQNFGNLKVHTDGALGFHHDLINNGFTDDNQGLVGFFSNNNILVSGAFRPIFRDIEIMVENDLLLDVGIGVTNNSNFILGNVFTPRNQIDINLDYINFAFYNGNENSAKVDGYAAATDRLSFSFPIGDYERLRPLKIGSTTTALNAKAAYFFEPIGSSTEIDTSFITLDKENIILNINTHEFWDLNCDTESIVSLSWDDRSDIENLVADIENLRVIGWHTQNQIWQDLGNTALNGNSDAGWVQSRAFVPDDYTILTLAAGLSKDDVSFENFLLTPNKDGVNDFFEIKAIAISPNNQLKIFNRWGRAVYVEENYSNGFIGKSNTGLVVEKNKNLPVGVYFYVIELKDIDVLHQGFLYISD